VLMVKLPRSGAVILSGIFTTCKRIDPHGRRRRTDNARQYQSRRDAASMDRVEGIIRNTHARLIVRTIPAIQPIAKIAAYMN